jgi:V8-like Glu-specific endopeptidase
MFVMKQLAMISPVLKISSQQPIRNSCQARPFGTRIAENGNEVGRARGTSLAASLPFWPQHRFPERKPDMRNTVFALSTLCVTAASAANAQATFASDDANVTVESVVVVGDSLVGPGVGINNPLYLPPATDANYSGVVNIWMRNAAGQVTSACSGSLLNNRNILTAGHCVSTGTNAITPTSFTARFRNADGTFTEVNGTGFRVQQNYSGAVVEEQDVAVLTLSADAPATARRYSLFTGNPLVEFTMAGYGRTGTGVTGGTNNIANNQFGAVNVLRAGRNVFETTRNDAGSFATNVNPDPAAFAGILVADFDRIGQSIPNNFICGPRTVGGPSLGFCGAGVALESSIGSGDSGSAALTDSWEVLGVASWGTTTNNVGSLYGSYFGYACVANYAPNARCVENYNFVVNSLVPEPSTYALMATGLIGMFGVARRRRNSNN